MKTILGLLVMSLMMVTNAYPFGAAPPSPSGGGFAGEIQCRAYDTGWEEHGSHASCTECLAAHDNCDTKCYSFSYTCTASGTEVTGPNGETKQTTVEAIDRDEVRARGQALNHCYELGLRNCSVQSCLSDSNLLSVVRCPK